MLLSWCLHCIYFVVRHCFMWCAHYIWCVPLYYFVRTLYIMYAQCNNLMILCALDMYILGALHLFDMQIITTFRSKYGILCWNYFHLIYKLYYLLPIFHCFVSQIIIMLLAHYICLVRTLSLLGSHNIVSGETILIYTKKKLSTPIFF